jgi:hypothetical protein
MDRHISLTLLVVALTFELTAAGCSNSSSSSPAPSQATTEASAAKEIPTDPAARATYDFLEAVVKADDQRVAQLLTPLAMQKIQASGKSIHLPGLENYKFHVEQVRYLSENDAIVQCKGADRTGGKDIQEEHEWMLHRYNDQWKIAAIAFQPDPKSDDMIYSFEHPEWGPIPAQQFRARMMSASQPQQPTADAGSAATNVAGTNTTGNATGPILGGASGAPIDSQSPPAAGGQVPRTAQEGQIPSYR